MAIVSIVGPAFSPLHRFHNHSIYIAIEFLHTLYTLPVLDLHSSRVKLDQVDNKHEVKHVRYALQQVCSQVPPVVVLLVMLIGMEDLM